MVSAAIRSLPAAPWSFPVGGWLPPVPDASVEPSGAFETERAQLLEKMGKDVGALESWLESAAAQGLEPRYYAVVRAQARELLVQCDLLVAAMDPADADAGARRCIDDLSGRLDEIVDVLGRRAETGDVRSRSLPSAQPDAEEAEGGVLRLSREAQIAFWQALQNPPPPPEAQRRLGALVRSVT